MSRRRSTKIASVAVGNITSVTITQRMGADRDALFSEFLDACGLWSDLERCCDAATLTRERFAILIKPDCDWFARSGPGGTEPSLVEALIDLLHERGFRRVAVGEGRNSADAWLHNRECGVVADLVGYRLRTKHGRKYEIVDLHADQAEPRGQSGTPLPAARDWIDADYRINFAKNRTHERYRYALCVHNLAGVSPRARDASRDRAVPEACCEVLRLAPAQFNLIDAFTSAQGSAGERAPRPLATHTFVGSTDAVLADWAAAIKMGLDPHDSLVNEHALRAVGLPERYQIIGDLEPYARWRNVHPLVAHSARLRSQPEGIGSLAGAWFQAVDREAFPFREFATDRINSFLAPLMERLDQDRSAFWLVILANVALARVGSSVAALHTLFAKSRLRRQQAPLSIDLARFEPADYEGIGSELASYERLLDGAPASRSGIRWRRVGGAVVFSGAHVFPIPFDRFTEQVDVARSITFMNDYIGGSTVAVREDRRRRVRHQAERNLYLQQPNWMVLFGSDVIDVEKLERVEYGADRHEIAWKTVASPNRSAIHDDGRVVFARDGEDRTRVTLFTRQQFALPLFFQIFDVHLLPEVRDPIIEAAYERYLAGTIENLQAAFDGREFRIGESAEALRSGDLARYFATAAAALAEVIRHRGDVLDLAAWMFPSQTEPAPARAHASDDRGFRHFDAAPHGTRYARQAGAAGRRLELDLAAWMRDAPDFLSGLADSIQNDLARVAETPG